MFDRQTLLTAKEKYLDFIADWPERFSYRGENFKELFGAGDNFSLWWLSETQKKDPEGSPVFENLCRLIKGDKPEKIISGFRSTLIWQLLTRLKFVTYIFFKVLIFRFFIKEENIDQGAKGEILFASMYPVMLRLTGGKLHDRNYLNIIEDVQNTLSIETKYISFYHGPIFGLWKERKKLRASGIIFYEQHLSFRDIAGAFDLAHILKYIFLERKKEFRESFDFNGNNIFSLLKHELRVSFVGKSICEYLLLLKSAESIIKERNVRAIVTFLEMYPYSRALYYAAKISGRGVKTIAYQHASITPMKLWYSYRPSELADMPVPDRFLFNGTMGRDILVRSGYPKENTFLAGSLRLDGAVNSAEGELSFKVPNDKKIVLVATTFLEKDSNEIIRIAFEASRAHDGYFFIFKAHANYPIDAELKKYDFKDCLVTNDNIYALIRKSGVLITSYSTTAEEAIALGCPVVIVETGSLINMGVMFEIEAAPVAHNERELIRALDLVFCKPAEFKEFKDKWPKLLEASFYKVDGKVKERFIGFLRSELGIKKE